MLDFGRPPLNFDGVTVFFDHADESTFYALPAAPRLALDEQTGQPILSLVLFRGGATGGGLLEFEAWLGFGPDDLEALGRQLVDNHGVASPNVVLPPWVDGDVSLEGWMGSADDATLTLTTLGTARPDLGAGARVLLGARLTEAGAALAQASLADGGLPGVLRYHLQALALSGPLGLEVDADLHGIHEKLSLQGALSTPFGRARIGATFDDMVREGLIRTRVTDESGDTESTRAEALRRSGEHLVAEMFTPVAPRASAAALDAPGGLVQLQFLLRKERDHLSQTATWSFTERRAVRLHHHAAAALVGVVAPADATALVREVSADPAAAGFEHTRLLVRAAGVSESRGFAAVIVRMQWPDATGADLPAASGEVVLTPEAPESALTAAVPWGAPFRYQVEAVRSAAAATLAPLLTDWLEGDGTVLVVDPARLFPVRTVLAVAGRFDPAHIEQVMATFTCGTTLSAGFTRPGESSELTWPDPPDDSPVTVEVMWLGRTGEPSWDEPAREVAGPLALLDPPFGDPISVVLVRQMGDDAATLVVELRHEEPESGFRHDRTVDLSDQVVTRVVLRRLALGPRTWQYRWMLVRNDGTFDECEWQVGSGGALLVGDPTRRAWQLDLVLISGPPDPTTQPLVEVVVEALHTGEQPPPSVRHLFTDDETRAEATLLTAASERLEWRATVRRYSVDGSVTESGSIGTGTTIALG